MTGKETSNIVLKEELDNLYAKVKILEDALMNLTTKLANDQNEEKEAIEKTETTDIKVNKTNADNNAQIKCKDCEFICQKMSTLKKHMKEVHTIQPVEHNCTVCDKTFDFINRL